MSDYLENLVDYKIITIYPTMAYVFFLFCKKYYKYILHYNLLVLDMYCESSEISKDFGTSQISFEFLKEFDMYDNTDNYEPINSNNMENKETQTDNYYNNIIFAFNQIPT